MRSTADLRRAILSRDSCVAVIGQGYVGLSLACAAAEAGFRVTGVDVDASRVEHLSRGRAAVAGVEQAALSAAVATGRLSFTTSARVVRDCRLVLVCVPTPLREGMPDLSFVDQACQDVAEHLAPGSLVVLESTTYPGTTEERVRPILERPGLVAGHDFLLAYSPERIDPGGSEFSFRRVPRVVGGVNPEATGMAVLFYEQLVDKVMSVSSARAAELAKLLENTFRHVNIALVNEMAMLCHEVGIDVWEVIEAAATKPFGFMRFSPGPGVGGHCIPLDPTYLAWQVRRDAGHQFRVLEEAEDINAQMPAWVAARIGEVLNDRGKPVKEAGILVLGAAYKPDVGDVRESPSIRVMNHLYRRGARISYHDPYIDQIAMNGGRLHCTELTTQRVQRSDLVALLTPHAAYDLDWLAEHAQVLFDARNAYRTPCPENVVRL
ncbi:MAG TPA: nucleotide sugar dehydrogenase [Actinomycetota bacterium]|nr:nucleotide sugar dehydrogenase [Actinomycetota bacterium]